MSPIFFYLRHFTFILQHLVLIVKNTFSHIFICMFDEIIKKWFYSCIQLKNLYLPQKNNKFKPIKKAIPSWGYSINTMEWIILGQVIEGGLFVPRCIQCTCNTSPIAWTKVIQSMVFIEYLHEGIIFLLLPY
jgi:hypothetical protein